VLFSYAVSNPVQINVPDTTLIQEFVVSYQTKAHYLPPISMNYRDFFLGTAFAQRKEMKSQ